MIDSIDFPKWLVPVMTSAEAAVVDLIARRFQITDTTVLTACALTVLAQREGHSCVDLDHVADLVRPHLDDRVEAYDLAEVPTATVYKNALMAHPSIVRSAKTDLRGTMVEARKEAVPFVLMGNSLYTQRQFVDELSIALQVSARSQMASTELLDAELVDRIVPKPSADDEAASKAGDTGIANRAAKSFISRRFTVLTGGPGTGKTFTLTRCVAALLATRESQSLSTKLALAAPTGKAATRAKDLLTAFVSSQRVENKDSLGLSDGILDQLERVEPRTIHRVLGSKARQRTRFAHDEQRPLDIDVLIVDEMSMVPSALMARLLEAMRPDATILLVGDQAQLEAVESGSVLREIVEVEKSLDQSSSWAFELLVSRRQDKTTRIGDLAIAIRTGNVAEALTFTSNESPGIKLFEAVGKVDMSSSPLYDYLKVMKDAKTLAESTDPVDHKHAFEKVSKNKLLCGPRQGRLGVNHWNIAIHESIFGVPPGASFEPGVPLLVTVNSARSRLVNGDIGLVVNAPSPDGTVTRAVYFPDGETGRYVSIAQLPPIEICFAMTIHKSQGSEYDHLAVILPNRESPLLNRELVYTAVTRAKKSLIIIGQTEQLSDAIKNRSVRYSALGSMIRDLS